MKTLTIPILIGILLPLAVVTALGRAGFYDDYKAAATSALLSVPMRGDSVRVFVNGTSLEGYATYRAGAVELTPGGGLLYARRADSIRIWVTPDGAAAGLVQFIGGTVILSAAGMLEDIQRPAWWDLEARSYAGRQAVFDILQGDYTTEETAPDSVRIAWGGLSATLSAAAFRNLSRKSAVRRENIRRLTGLLMQ